MDEEEIAPIQISVSGRSQIITDSQRGVGGALLTQERVYPYETNNTTENRLFTNTNDITLQQRY